MAESKYIKSGDSDVFPQDVGGAGDVSVREQSRLLAAQLSRKR